MKQLLKQRAIKLRRNDSQAECILWNMLRNRKLNRHKFRRQYVIEPYIVDFICLHKKLIIELDGDHHQHQKEYDDRRTLYLEKLGYNVVRFTNNDLFCRDEQLIDEVMKMLE